MCFHVSDGYQSPGRNNCFQKGEHVPCYVRSVHILESLQNVALHVTLVTRASSGDSLMIIRNSEMPHIICVRLFEKAESANV